jgi:hypothetical protein
VAVVLSTEVLVVLVELVVALLVLGAETPSLVELEPPDRATMVALVTTHLEMDTTVAVVVLVNLVVLVTLGPQVVTAYHQALLVLLLLAVAVAVVLTTTTRLLMVEQVAVALVMVVMARQIQVAVALLMVLLEHRELVVLEL